MRLSLAFARALSSQMVSLAILLETIIVVLMRLLDLWQEKSLWSFSQMVVGLRDLGVL